VRPHLHHPPPVLHPVQVTNNTSAKITAFFSIPLWQDPAGGKPVQVFQVGEAVHMRQAEAHRVKWIANRQ
jgi:hypothetical protein